MLACNSNPLVHGWLWGTYSVTIWNLHAEFYYLWEFKTLRIFFSLRLIIDKMYIQLAQSCLSLNSTRKISMDMCNVGMFSMWATQNSTLPRGWFRRANTDRKSTRFYSNSGGSLFLHWLGSHHTVLFDWQVFKEMVWNEVLKREAVSHFNPRMQQHLCAYKILLVGDRVKYLHIKVLQGGGDKKIWIPCHKPKFSSIW